MKCLSGCDYSWTVNPQLGVEYIEGSNPSSSAKILEVWVSGLNQLSAKEPTLMGPEVRILLPPQNNQVSIEI